MEIRVATFSCLVLLSACHFSHGDYQGHITGDKLPWVNARQRCLDRPSCDLSAQKTVPEHADFWNSLALDAGTSYWVGAKLLERLQWQQSKSPLIEQMGCYVKPEGLQTEVRALRYNGPERCLTQCTGNLAAVQNTACYCLSEEEMTSLQERPLEECHLYCNKEAYRCGGNNSRLSVYKIPDRTLYQKAGKSTKFFWRRSNNNDKEFVLFTNKPGKQKKRFCVSSGGVYSAVQLKGSCPAGGDALSFQNVDVMEFLEKTSPRREWDTVSFQLPLVYGRQFLWLDGEAVSTKGGRGPCVALSYDGQQYSLVKNSCKAKLPSVCACYTPPLTTESTTTSTSTTPTTTTTPETTTTTTEATTTTTLTTESTTMTTTTSTTQAPDSTTDKEEEETSAGSLEKTSTRTAEETSTSVPEDMGASTAAATAVFATTGNDTTLTTDMKDPDGPSRVEPPSASSGESTSDGGKPATAAASLELIVGVTVGALALLLMVVIIVIVLRRKKKASSASLLRKKNAAQRATNYPI